jgi:pantetheine-phosphate adenylyltransferase
MKKIAVFPGSFDPITKGHESLVRRAMPLFDEIIIAIGHNADKQSYFPLKKRLEWLAIVFKDMPKVKIESYSGLTVDFCLKHNANFILRGLRTSADFEFERRVGQVNKYMNQKLETIFLLSSVEDTPVNSSVVREIHKYGGNIGPFIPSSVVKLIQNWQ